MARSGRIRGARFGHRRILGGGERNPIPGPESPGVPDGGSVVGRPGLTGRKGSLAGRLGCSMIDGDGSGAVRCPDSEGQARWSRQWSSARAARGLRRLVWSDFGTIGRAGIGSEGQRFQHV